MHQVGPSEGSHGQFTPQFTATPNPLMQPGFIPGPYTPYSPVPYSGFPSFLPPAYPYAPYTPPMPWPSTPHQYSHSHCHNVPDSRSPGSPGPSNHSRQHKRRYRSLSATPIPSSPPLVQNYFTCPLVLRAV
ncbi:hypothetical protein M404DRAFT_609077 [Pisolithus tinctorius Marx 270]|uniref:Uncharacterized protein n=1 Tax=Pisolithus tinctorius Marx 270 TaxID=870435 RepID=A0A0C3P8R8_PISTI|nr:hypothetical protein M404DRAFT_609077 [Pisolithus tinctorius Marx 270]